MSESFPQASPQSSQWQRLLKNVGTWQGSFTRLSAQGQLLEDVSTEVALVPQDDDKAMHQEVRRYPPDQPPQIKAFDYRSLNRSTRFFEGGAFSQGSVQWGPSSEFGAELGLIAGNRRLRLVQLFDTAGECHRLTLIRERRQSTDAPERDALKLSDLLGTWQGEAVTQYADLRPEETQRTQLTLEKVSDRDIRQTLTFANGLSPLSSTGVIDGQIISFDQGAQPVRVLLLPDGASATFPPRITPRRPLFLEAGWLLDSNTRQRIVRSYDAAGAWVSLTLVTEYKQ